MRTTFNNSRDKAENKATGTRNMNSRIADFREFMQRETGDNEELREAGDDNLCGFHEYGLGIDYVAPGTFEGQKRGYLRYQLGYGGPSDEVRFYYQYPNCNKPDRIEYVYMDWGTGVGFDCGAEDWAQWLWDWFWGCETTRAECEKSLTEAGLL